MFTDPQSITISGATSSLPRTSVDGDKTEYTSSDGAIQLSASHQETGGGKRNRRMLRLDTSKWGTDPYRDDVNVELSMSIYMVFDVPRLGYTVTDQLAV
jgi:hypothetical protein